MIFCRIRNGQKVDPDGTGGAREDDIMGTAGDILTAGVVGKSLDSCKVVASATPDMVTNVKKGVVYVPNSAVSPGAFLNDAPAHWQFLIDQDTPLTPHSPNSSGSARIDRIVLRIDTTVEPNKDASNIGSLQVIEGTPGGTAPAIPTNSYPLGLVNVPNGATAITDADIVDTRENVKFTPDMSSGLISNDMANALALGNDGLLKVRADGWNYLTDSATLSGYNATTRLATISGLPVGYNAHLMNGMKGSLINNGVQHFFFWRTIAATSATIEFVSTVTTLTASATDILWSVAATPQGFPSDTGWLELTTTAAVVATSKAFRRRKKDGICWVQGVATGSPAIVGSGEVVIAELPDGFKPSQTFAINVRIGNNIVPGQILSTGLMYCMAPYGGVIVLEPIAYIPS